MTFWDCFLQERIAISGFVVEVCNFNQAFNKFLEICTFWDCFLQESIGILGFKVEVMEFDRLSKLELSCITI